jgi:hypothetical protein
MAPLLSPEDVASERAFAELCARSSPHTIGASPWGPVTFDFRAAPVPVASDDPHLEDDLLREEKQHRAYASILAFHRPFRQELEQLKAAWNRIKKRPGFGPWSRPTKVRVRNKAAADYYRKYDTFRARWRLFGLASWDLPRPLPRLIKMSLSDLNVLFNGAGRFERLFDFMPHYLSTSRSVTRYYERSVREEDGVRATGGQYRYLPDLRQLVWREPDLTKEITKLEMLLIELSVLRRYGCPRGLQARVISGFAKRFKKSDAHIKRLRLTYSHLTDPAS